MPDATFLVATGIAGVALAYGLLWVLTQFLKTDAEVEEMDRAIRSSTNELESLGTTPAPKPAVVPQVDPQQALRDRYARDEQMLAKALFRWGTAIWLLSMVIGGIWSGFVGALLGGVLGAVVGTIGVVAVVAYKARRLPVTAPAPEQPDALRAAEPAPAPAEPRHPATVER